MTTVGISEERGVRYLHLGSTLIQGAMRLSRPFSLELEYTREMMMPLVLRTQRAWPRSVLQVGLGAASITRFLYRHRPRAALAVVEVSPGVVAAARQFFRLPEDASRLEIEVGDGFGYMARTPRRFDLILVDAFDARGRTGGLDTQAFWCNCRARLSDSGMLATNLLTRRGVPTRGVTRIDAAFDGRVLVLPPCPSGNAIAVAATGAPVRTSAAGLRAGARRLLADTGLDLLPTVARLVAARGGIPDALTL
jgi:spermidine synthase